MAKEGTSKVVRFSGETEDWLYFKTSLIASASDKKNGALDRWLDVVDENLNDEKKWKVTEKDPNGTDVAREISKEENKKLFNFLVQRLEKEMVMIIGGEYRNDGLRAWQFLLATFESRESEDGCVLLLEEIMETKLEDVGTSKYHLYLSNLSEVLARYERTTGKLWSVAERKAFLVHSLRKTED